MDLGLAGRRALVLGASRGLGAAVGRALAEEGASVVAGSRSGTANWSADLGRDASARVRAVRLDVSDRAMLHDTIATLLAEAPFDVLINNSGGPPPGTVQSVEAATWDTQFAAMATNLFAAASLVLPGMVERGWGRIVTIASSGVEQPIPNLGISNTVRASVVGWSKTLAAEVAPHGVTVNVVLPGRIHTARTDELDAAAARRTDRAVEEIARDSRASIPVARYGREEEFGAVVAFLASARASYVTGSRIRVDGGAIRSI